MKGTTHTRLAPEVIENGAPTVENLLRHYRAYGLDNQHKGNNVGKPVRYATYKQFRNDSLVEVGRANLAEDAYAFLIESLGHPTWADAARADWVKVREEE